MHVLHNETEVEYTAMPHGIPSQPPASIRDYTAKSRDVLLNGMRTPFYFGTVAHGTRVNFQLGGIWYHITATEPPNHNLPNLFNELEHLDHAFSFATLGED